eukprot:TRINITY_DN1132_c0_g1_i1.p1 TRINITY_DN1132_c0_g1~~TRINITY_DN1132_c0_g1_i1.p1  ORF type:complete len:1583 (+),score=151.93 TRINITY_DN1132_c0_g1_i1:1986-6734(+)
MLNLTVLYVPLLGTLLSVLSCKNGYITLQQTIQCWNFGHTLHATFGGIFAVLFFVWQILASLLFFETSWLAKTALSRKWSSLPTLEILLQSALVLIEIFIELNQAKLWSIGILVVVGYGKLLFTCVRDLVFVSSSAQTAYLLYTAGSLWIGCCLLISEIISPTQFTGGFPMLGLSMILVGLIILCVPTRISLNKLVKSPDEQPTPREALLTLQETLKLVENKDNREFSYVTYGLILQHSLKCNRPECALAEIQRNLYSQQNAKLKAMKARQRAVNRGWNMSLLNYLNHEFFLCINKYPKDVSLRLFYSLFLIERLNNTPMAMNELLQCSKRKPGFVDQFLIYRYKQLVKDHIITSSKSQNQSYSVATAIAYEGTFKKFRGKIEKAAVSHMQFWSLLWEESPNMQKLTQTGFKILSTIESIEELWEKLQQIFFNNPKAAKLYTNFCSNVINDIELSKGLLSKVKEYVFTKSHAMTHLIEGFTASAVSKDGSPCVIVNSQPDNIGIITECNLALCRLFGYTKKDLVGARINRLMPDIYAKNHTDLMLQYLEYEDHGENSVKKEIHAFGLHKSGYIFPLTVKLLGVPSFLNNFSFMAVFAVDKLLASSSIAFLLTDKKKIVRYVTSSAMTLLDLEKSVINTEEVSVSHLLPDLFSAESVKKYLEKAGAKIACNCYTKSRGETPGNQHQEESVKELQCELQEIRMKRHGVIGYTVKLQLLDTTSISIKNCLKPPPFQFRYDEGLNKYFREPYPDAPSNEDSFRVSSQHFDSEHFNAKGLADTKYSPALMKKDAFSHHKELGIYETKENFLTFISEATDQNLTGFYATVLPKIKHLVKIAETDPRYTAASISQELGAFLVGKKLNFGKEVTTLRLLKGEEVEIKDEFSHPPMLFADNSVNMYGEDEEGRGRRDLTSVSNLSQIKSRESFKLKLMEAAQPKELTILFLASLIIAACLISFSVILYVYSATHITEVKERLESVHKANRLMAKTYDAVFIARELVLVRENLSVYDKAKRLSKAQYYSELREPVTELSDSMNKLLNTLMDNSYHKTNPQFFDSLYFDKRVGIKTLPKDTIIIERKHTFPEGILVFISNLFAVSGLNETDFTGKNYHVYAVLENGFNSIADSIKEVTDKYEHALYLEEDKNMDTILAFFIISVCVSALFLPVVLIFIRLIHARTEQIMKLFLEIPAATLKQLSTRCENFLHNLRQDVEGDVDSVFDELLEGARADLLETDHISRRLRKFSNRPNFMEKFTFVILFTIGALSGFFVANYLLEISHRNAHKEMSAEFEQVSSIEWVAHAALDYQRECFYGEELKIQGDQACKQSLNMLDRAYKTTRIMENLSIQPKLTDESVQTIIHGLLKGNLCKNSYGLYINSSYIVCEEFAEGILQQGLSLVISYYFKLLRQTLTEFNENKVSPQQVLLSEWMQKAYILQEEFIGPLMVKVLEYWLEGAANEGSKLVTLRLSILITFIFVLGFAFIFFWRPFLNYMRETVRTVYNLFQIGSEDEDDADHSADQSIVQVQGSHIFPRKRINEQITHLISVTQQRIMHHTILVNGYGQSIYSAIIIRSQWLSRKRKAQASVQR